jgi:hypothetical protein
VSKRDHCLMSEYSMKCPLVLKGILNPELNLDEDLGKYVVAFLNV